MQELNYSQKVKKSENLIIKNNEIQKYLIQHKKKYDNDLSVKNFINQLTELIIYGFGCSDGGSYNPPEAKKMTQWVEQKNIVKLSEWLRQINPELQAYAITGLIELKKTGIQICNKDLEIIDHIRTRNSEIYHCAGCLYGMTTTIEEILN